VTFAGGAQSQPGATLKARLLPVIARQTTATVTGPRATAPTARVVASALRMRGFENRITAVEVVAFSEQAWVERHKPDGFGGSVSDVHPCVETDEVLIDACLDLLSAPGTGLSLRPSTFDLPLSWARERRATFQHPQSGAVVACRVADGVDWGDDPHQEVLIERIAGEVVEMCERAERALPDVAASQSRWLPIADPAGDR
jgi:hypothetical protein